VYSVGAPHEGLDSAYQFNIARQPNPPGGASAGRAGQTAADLHALRDRGQLGHRRLLNKVGLRAELIGSPEAPAASTTTDAKGSFTLVSLPPGKYRLKGVRNGFLDTYYGARRSEGAGTTIVLEAGQEMKDLQIKLMPFGVIAGTVRDAAGEPLSGASVTILRLSYHQGRRIIEENVEAKTDDLGQYRFADLPPGKYYVRAAPGNEGNQYGFRVPIDHSVKSAEPLTALLPTL
jgi:hypothetical protein